MIDLINIRSIDINLADESAWIQAGATLGLCPSRVISGGGFGTLFRKHGLAADHVVDAYLIDVNGRILNRKSMGEDIFWAIRGGSAATFGRRSHKTHS
ncbi:FAD-binding berberine family protein [Medicago truncatula]|uniref:FAD-binding berberine family protein n=1 Tax=Medicago truncatula TaxID=3880 RepID=A0A072VBD0_MEDTR|nr:FAD-binding berberine family protein [Medicago truncatula]